MILTRDLINPNIEFRDFLIPNSRPTVYGYEKLNSYIDHYKNLLQQQGLKKGNSILIGLKPSLDQTACLFAASELGLIITIANPGKFTVSALNSGSKMDQILPIDCFVIDIVDASEKNLFFQKLSNTTIETFKITEIDSTPNSTIDVESSSPIMKCISTGESIKPIVHTHQFFYHLIKRNSVFLNDKVGISSNLNHGSSFATFYLPSLIAKDVKEIVNFSLEVTSVLKRNPLGLTHLMLPYPQVIENYIENVSDHHTTLWTLSGLRPEWKELLGTKFKDIISMFGSNETSGPLFVNSLKEPAFSFNSYRPIDNFYQFNINEKQELEVTMPVYGNTVSTGDLFELNKGRFNHLGRPGVERINGQLVDYAIYQKHIKEYLDADMIVDSSMNKIYLAVYKEDNNIESKLQIIDTEMRKSSKNLHYISKWRYIDKIEFSSGIKLNTQKVIEYFRKQD